MSDLPRRLAQVLDAYGASPDRWPAEDRRALLALLEEFAEARARRDEAARLDAWLDAAGDLPAPSRRVADRIVDGFAAAPAPGHRSVARRWLAAAVIPVAAAAALVLWLTRGPAPTGTDASFEIAFGDLGVYTTPTDVLLEIDGFDPLESVPGYDCDDDGLGCLDLGRDDGGATRHSMQGGSRRMTT